MVSLDPKFAKEVLNSISLEADNIDHLTSGRVSHYTRIAYLKFLIALLIGADNSLVMVVVNKPCEFLHLLVVEELKAHAVVSKDLFFST